MEAQKKGLRLDVNPLLFTIPACFDTVACFLMYLALTMVAAGIFQMLRGTVVFFTSMLSIIFLKRRLHRHHWSSLLFIVGGVAIVGVAAFQSNEASSPNPKMGIILLVAA